MRFLIILCIGCLLTGIGCIRTYHESPGVSGQLIDGATGEPLARKDISLTISYFSREGSRSVTATTSAEGMLNVRPLDRPVFWIAGELAVYPPIVEISASGFQTFVAHDIFECNRGQGEFPVYDYYVRIGEVKMRRKYGPALVCGNAERLVSGLISVSVSERARFGSEQLTPGL